MSENPLPCWVEWKEKCQLDRCSDETARYLTDFIFTRFKKQQHTAGVGRYAVPDQPVLGPDEACHLFESYYQIKDSIAGKAYKDWLFDRAKGKKNPLSAIEGGVSVLNKSAVKEFLRREFSLRIMDSFDRALTGSEGSSLTLHDLLPGTVDPSCDVEMAEYRDLGELAAAKLAADLNEPEIVCLLAKSLSISLADPRVTELAGKRPTALYDAYNHFLQRMYDSVKSDYPGEDEESLQLLTVTTYEALNRLIIVQKKAEKTYAGLFALVEDNEKTAQN
jgi:hypothetical protein